MILYITINGVSFDMFNTTWVESPPAFENKFKYLEAKLRDTGSSTSKRIESFSFPVSCWLKVEFPLPISPLIENLMFYLLVSMRIDSERPTNYLQILVNSLEGMVQIEVNYVSGIPKFYESIVIRERLNSDILSPPVLLKFYTL